MYLSLIINNCLYKENDNNEDLSNQAHQEKIFILPNKRCYIYVSWNGNMLLLINSTETHKFGYLR